MCILQCKQTGLDRTCLARTIKREFERDTKTVDYDSEYKAHPQLFRPFPTNKLILHSKFTLQSRAAGPTDLLCKRNHNEQLKDKGQNKMYISR